MASGVIRLGLIPQMSLPDPDPTGCPRSYARLMRELPLPSAPAQRALALAGPDATVQEVCALAGGTHARTYRIQTANPEREIILRQFPPGDDAADHETQVLAALDGLGGLAPRLLASSPAGAGRRAMGPHLAPARGRRHHPRPARHLRRAARRGSRPHPHDLPDAAGGLSARLRPARRIPHRSQRPGRQPCCGPLGTPRQHTGRADALRLLVRQHALAGRHPDRRRGLDWRGHRPTRLRPGLVPTGPVPAVRPAHRRQIPGLLPSGEQNCPARSAAVGPVGRRPVLRDRRVLGPELPRSRARRPDRKRTPQAPHCVDPGPARTLAEQSLLIRRYLHLAVFHCVRFTNPFTDPGRPGG